MQIIDVERHDKMQDTHLGNTFTIVSTVAYLKCWIPIRMVNCQFHLSPYFFNAHTINFRYFSQ